MRDLDDHCEKVNEALQNETEFNWGRKRSSASSQATATTLIDSEVDPMDRGDKVLAPKTSAVIVSEDVLEKQIRGVTGCNCCSVHRSDFYFEAMLMMLAMSLTISLTICAWLIIAGQHDFQDFQQ